ncbi:MAG: hypothetical protein SWH54_17970 [Thermodesulfobacteriota bacterium]|nr:hypothetical protein [Thermodesulfobacteriota bacterium]
MPVLDNIKIDFSIDELLNFLKKDTNITYAVKKEAIKAFSKACKLCTPAIVYKLMQVEEINHTNLQVKGSNSKEEYVLNIGSNVNLLKPAQMIFVFLYTIGGAIDKESDKNNKAGNYLQSYLLDSIGVLMLGKTGDIINKIVEKEAAQRSWGVGGILSPGSLKGWSLLGQKQITKILDPGLIGVQINEASVLKPFKSVTSIIGMGHEYPDHKVGTMCQYCSNADICNQYCYGMKKK